jgi:vacuolar-type H+-ATPase subunit I/STV1
MAIGAAVGPWVLVLVAVCAGVYGAFAAPELALGAPGIAPLLGLPGVLPGAPWDRPLLAAILVGLGALLVATAAGLRRQVVPHPLWPAIQSPALWVLIAATAAIVLLGPEDPWRALSLGCGLAASAIAAPALAGAGSRARLAGAVAGAGAFAALAFGIVGVGLPGAVAAYPVLVSAPLAFAVASLGGAWIGRANSGRSVAARQQG